VYLDHYSLKEFPFNITPDPKFLYYSEHHREAYDHLMYGIAHRKGFIELTGEVGSGKTTICRAVLSALGKEVETAVILNPMLTETQLIKAMLSDFGLEIRARDRFTYIKALNEFLLARNKEGVNVALFVDEAQDLSPELMEQVRLLSNLETDHSKLIQIVLCGQPELKKRLNRPDLRQLKQRITVRYSIPPLTEDEVREYVQHRMRVAGASNDMIFGDGATREVFRYSKGSPRVINAVCDTALLAGFGAGVVQLDKRCVRRAIKQLEGTR